MKNEIAVTLLWTIALATTALVVRQASLLTVLAPLFAVCMIGSVVSVRRARMEARSNV